MENTETVVCEVASFGFLWNAYTFLRKHAIADPRQKPDDKRRYLVTVEVPHDYKFWPPGFNPVHREPKRQ